MRSTAVHCTHDNCGRASAATDVAATGPQTTPRGFELRRWLFLAVATTALVLNLPQAAFSGPSQKVATGPPGWQIVVSMPQSIFGAASDSDGTYAYAAGGYASDITETSDALYRYSPAADTWATMAPMPQEAFMASAVYYPPTNKLYVFGGTDPDADFPFDITRIYDIASNTWTTGASMPGSRFTMASGYNPGNGKIYLVGGYTGNNLASAQDQTWEYDPVANTWAVRMPIPHAFGGAASGIIDGRLYIAGGRDAQAMVLDLVWEYSIAANTWTQRASMPAPTNAPASAVAEGKLWAIGGGAPYRPGRSSASTTASLTAPNATGKVLTYEPRSDTWLRAPDLNVSRSFVAGANVSGTLVAAGGYTPPGDIYSTTETLSVEGPPPPPPPPPPAPPPPPPSLGASCKGSGIAIPDSGTGSPYPSTCTVSGLTGTITDVNVRIRGLSHTSPDDIDILLVRPGGNPPRSATVLSDAGGSLEVSTVDVTLDDEAASQLPDSGQISTGSYRPANYPEYSDIFPNPAPGTDHGWNLSTFDGGLPNGTWSMYLVDDAGLDVGHFTSWSLTITTTGGPPPPPPPPPPPGSWAAAAPYPVTNVRYAFADLGEEAYVIGGVTNLERIPDVNRYDASTNTWTPRAPIPVASQGPCGAHWNGKIYVAEGDTGNSFQIYDIATNTWTQGAPRPVANGYGCAAGALNGKVYVIGGNGAPQTQLTVYDIASNTWMTGMAATTGVFFSGYQTAGDYLYIVGGFGTTSAANSTATMRLDMRTGTWSMGPAFTPQRADFALATFGTKLYAIGGDTTGGNYFNSTDLVHELDTASWPGGSWVLSPAALPAPRQANQAGFSSTGRGSGRFGGEIWSTGGVNGNTLQFMSDHLYRATTSGPPQPPPLPPPPPPPTERAAWRDRRAAERTDQVEISGRH